MDMTIGVSKSASQRWDRRLIHGVLGNTDLFRGISPALIGAMAAQCWTIEAKRAQQLVSKGGRLKWLPKGGRLPGIFGIGYGTGKLALRQGAAEPRVVRLAAAGETFGE